MPQQAYRSYSYKADYFTGSWVVPAPTGMQVGDVMVCFCVGNDPAYGLETLYGWGVIQDIVPVGTFRLQIYWKTANWNDVQAGVTYSWVTHHLSMAGGIYAIANALQIIDKMSTVWTTSTNDALLKATPITPSGPNEMLMWFAGGIAPGCDSRTPSSIPMYFNNYNGGGGGANQFGITSGIKLYAGGLTNDAHTNGPIYAVHTSAQVTMLTLRTNFAPHEVANPLMTEV